MPLELADDLLPGDMDLELPDGIEEDLIMDPEDTVDEPALAGGKPPQSLPPEEESVEAPAEGDGASQMSPCHATVPMTLPDASS